MKKILLLACAFLAGASLFAQKNKKDLPIKTEKDTVSYSYGASLAQQGLAQYLTQQGLFTDTASVRQSYASKVSATPTDKAKLDKELAVKLDSINKANKANVTDLINGIALVLQSDETKKAYMEGLSLGGQMSKMIPSFSEQMYGNNKEINKDLFLQGLRHALSGDKVQVENSFDIINQMMSEAQTKQMAQQEEGQKAQNAEYIAEGDRFMAENKAKEGVVTLPSGLQYKVLKAGTGAIPKASDQVKVHYRGSLIDGTVFDSSIDRGEPIVFGVSQVIKGWTEALQLMPVGSKWMLYIPYNLGYGGREAGSIKPFSNLIFEVELLGIE